MDELWEFLLIVCAIVIALAVMAAAFAVAATAACICVFGAATHAFVTTLHRGIVHRGGSAAATGPEEPSFRAYYRGQVWTDLGLATRAAWRAANRETSEVRALVPQGWDPAVRAVLVFVFAVYAYVGLAGGALLAAAIGLLPAVLLLVFAAVAWALGAPLRAVERLRRRRSGAHFDCPDCHDRFPLPQYICPSCGARHGRLAPGPFGVLSHRCTCGARLPSVPWRGRERLNAECPRGHALGEGVGRVRTFHVPVAGGPSTGKSTFLAAALVELEDAAAAGRLATTVQATSRQAYEHILEPFRRGVPAAKTSGIPPAVVAEVRGSARSALLYAYDVGGEIYASEDELRRDPAHGLAEGVVLLVDPFALDRVRADLGDEIDAQPELGASAEPPQRVLERLIGVLEEQGVELARCSAAICVTKTDALGIGDAIAASAGDDDAERTRAWLEEHGAGNFVRAAQSVFKDVRCFSVSALGRTPGTGEGPFAPSGALAPLLWLLARAGIEPAAAGDAAPTTTAGIATDPDLDVAPKRPLLTRPIDAVSPLGHAPYFGIGLAAAAVLLLLTLPFSTIGGSGHSQAAAYGAGPGGTGGGDGGSTTYGETTSDTETDTSTETTETVETTPTETTPDEGAPKSDANTPAGNLKRHYERLSDGDYSGAFALMRASYRNANPRWVDERSAADPTITVDDTGPTRFAGHGVAYVHVKFYAHDTYSTAGSDTLCRRFEGDAQMVRENGLWRYSPTGNSYTTAVLPSDLSVCNS